MRVRLKTDVTVDGIQPGKEYVVLEITGRWLRLENEGELDPDEHGLWEARYFDVTNADVPRNWVIALDAEGRIELAPRRWLEPDFWSAFYDDETDPNHTWWQHVRRREEARRAFEEEVGIIRG